MLNNTNKKSLTAIVLSAGLSSRMGALKPLLSMGKYTVIERVVRCFKAAGIMDIRVVVGHRSEEISHSLQGTEVMVIKNDNFREGMFSSVVAGVRSLDHSIKGFFLMPADIPLIEKNTLEILAEVYEKSGAGLVYPCFKGRRGHPPVISAYYKAALMKWDRPGGMRSFLRQYESRSLDVEVADPGITMDMDTPEEYQNLLKNCQAEFNSNSG